MSGKFKTPAIAHNPHEADKGRLREKGTLDPGGFCLASISYLLCLHCTKAQGWSMQMLPC